MREIKVEFNWNLNLEEAKNQGEVFVIGLIGASISPIYKAKWDLVNAFWINVNTNTPFKEFVIKAWVKEKDILPKSLS